MDMIVSNTLPVGETSYCHEMRIWPCFNIPEIADYTYIGYEIREIDIDGYPDEIYVWRYSSGTDTEITIHTMIDETGGHSAIHADHVKK